MAWCEITWHHKAPPLQGNEVIQNSFGHKKGKKVKDVFHSMCHYAESLLSVIITPLLYYYFALDGDYTGFAVSKMCLLQYHWRI